MNSQNAHKELSAFCKNSNNSWNKAGIGISIELVRRIIEDQIQNLQKFFPSLISNQLFTTKNNEFEIKYESEIYISKSNVLFNKFINPQNEQDYLPTLIIRNSSILITGFISANNILPRKFKKVIQIKIDFNFINGLLVFRNRKLKIELNEEVHKESLFVRYWEKDEEIKNYFESNYDFEENDWQSLSNTFKAVSLFSSNSIADTLLNSLELPDILKVFKGIKFGEDSRLGASENGELLMFTASSALDFSNCPSYNPSGEISTTSKIKHKHKYYDIGELKKIETSLNNIAEELKTEDISIESDINPDSSIFQYPAGEDDDIESPHPVSDIYLFTPVELLNVNFDTVKPTLNASETGWLGPIYWRYSVNAVLQKPKLKLLSAYPTEFMLSLPSKIYGQSGAGIKIGCVRYEALGAMFDGDVSPFDIKFKIYFDFNRKQIVFISKIHQAKAHSFSFRTFPRAKWPISEIIDFILARASEYVLKDQAYKMIKVTRIPIADLSSLEEIATIQKGMSGVKDKNDNVTFGIKFKN